MAIRSMAYLNLLEEKDTVMSDERDQVVNFQAT